MTDASRNNEINRQRLLPLRVAALVGFSVWFGGLAAIAADTIYFQDGMRTLCEGSAWEKGDEVHCEYDGGLLIYRKSDVARIEKGLTVEPELDSKNAQEADSSQAPSRRPAPAPKLETPSASTPPKPKGIAFYDPRRPKKYWSSTTRQHDTFRDAISALAEEFNRSTSWIEENLGDSNELSEVRETLASRLSDSASAKMTSAALPGGVIEFYNPRRAQKYMTGPDTSYDSFHEALNALARDFDKPPDWVEQHMGESNDVDQIRQNLKAAQESDMAR
ncbi:MAG: hypothetical protein MUC57_00775 [Desulfobacterales bacterium]|jgi:hypothetical protein|nr:hypothetical protein [Desulfobacterales bacterium]